jgi:hypothetical protein
MKNVELKVKVYVITAAELQVHINGVHEYDIILLKRSLEKLAAKRAKEAGFWNNKWYDKDTLIKLVVNDWLKREKEYDF